MPAVIIEVNGIRKMYGAIVAVDEISLAVPKGTIFGMIGPNGAGKTTTVECIEGIRTPDAGVIRVLGKNPASDRSLFQRVGVQLQESSLYPRIRVGEAMGLFASFYTKPADPAALLKAFGLDGKERSMFHSLSGGQKRRVLVALALIGCPELAILDEPTSGLDPQSRYNMWTALREYRAQGGTILLTTHHLEEAQEHCDIVAVVDRGRIVAEGQPAALLQEHRLETRIALPANDVSLQEKLAGLAGVSRVEALDNQLLVYGEGGQLYAQVVEVALQNGISSQQMEVRPARLDDLFLLLTGRAYREV